MWRKAPSVHQAAVIEDNFAGRDIDAIVLKCRLICSNEKLDRCALRSAQTMGNCRKALIATLHPDPVQIDLHEPGAKVTPRGWDELHVCGANCHLVGMRVCELKNATPSNHVFSSPSTRQSRAHNEIPLAVARAPRAPLYSSSKFHRDEL